MTFEVDEQDDDNDKTKSVYDKVGRSLLNVVMGPISKLIIPDHKALMLAHDRSWPGHGQKAPVI